MMRPMKLGGSELLFGYGSLDYLENINASKVAIVTGGNSMKKNGTLARIEDIFNQRNIPILHINNVESDPSTETIYRGARELLSFEPDFIIGLGGGSAMDAAKAMWIFYEHPEYKSFFEILPPNPFPNLRQKAKLCCIPSTSGTASEVSRSIVITDKQSGLKYGLGNMEMMPDIAICDPQVTLSMPPRITAETGMDAMTHALEAMVSNRANYISDIFAAQAIEDIYTYLPRAYKNGMDREAREKLLLASMIAGMAFTNVSLGIVHSMAHTLGGLFHIAHGLADAILLPYIISFNKRDERAKQIYQEIEQRLHIENLVEMITKLNQQMNIPHSFHEIIEDEASYFDKLDRMVHLAAADGCTKTNPLIPTREEWIELFTLVYRGV